MTLNKLWIILNQIISESTHCMYCMYEKNVKAGKIKTEKKSLKKANFVFNSLKAASVDLKRQVLQKRCPSGQLVMSSNKHSSSKQQQHSYSSPLALASASFCSFAFSLAST